MKGKVKAWKPPGLILIHKTDVLHVRKLKKALVLLWVCYFRIEGTLNCYLLLQFKYLVNKWGKNKTQLFLLRWADGKVFIFLFTYTSTSLQRLVSLNIFQARVQADWSTKWKKQMRGRKEWEMLIWRVVFRERKRRGRRKRQRESEILQAEEMNTDIRSDTFGGKEREIWMERVGHGDGSNETDADECGGKIWRKGVKMKEGVENVAWRWFIYFFKPLHTWSAMQQRLLKAELICCCNDTFCWQNTAQQEAVKCTEMSYESRLELKEETFEKWLLYAFVCSPSHKSSIFHYSRCKGAVQITALISFFLWWKHDFI